MSPVLNTLILGNLNGSYSNGAYAIELDHRLPALLALYQMQCRVPLDAYHFGSELRTFISRGGFIHYVLGQPSAEGAESPLLGFATVLSSSSLLENIFPVERFVIDEGVGSEDRLAIATALIQSIIDQADQALSERHDDIWIHVAFPAGADSLEGNQPVYVALELSGFKACRSPGQVSWTNWLKRSELPTRLAA